VLPIGRLPNVVISPDIVCLLPECLIIELLVVT